MQAWSASSSGWGGGGGGVLYHSKNDLKRHVHTLSGGADLQTETQAALALACIHASPFKPRECGI